MACSHQATMSFFHTVATNSAQEVVGAMLSSTDDEEEEKKRGGSTPGRGGNVNRRRGLLGDILYTQYFSPNPTYDAKTFRRRFRVSRELFDRLFNAVVDYDPYFVQRTDCTGKRGLSPFQKITAAMRMLAYGVSADSVDDKIGIAESTTLKCLEHYCDAVIACFSETYLRAPTDEDMKHILSRSERRGFPGMMGSIDCTKWRWKNCPTAWQGQYRGKEKVSTVTLEAIADESLWIWHAFFGMPGCLNDINVVESSPLLEKMANGTYPPPVEYVINAIRRNIPYWLTDGIYPDWPVFIDSIMNPTTRKDKLFAAMQEATRKDVERAFGVLQSMWHIITTPSRFASVEMMEKVMTTVIILHNMVVEEREWLAGEEGQEFTEGVVVRNGAPPLWKGLVKVSTSSDSPAVPGTLAARCAIEQLSTRKTEKQITKRLLVQHIWAHHGDS